MKVSIFASRDKTGKLLWVEAWSGSANFGQCGHNVNYGELYVKVSPALV